jgi:hypothetical protein
MLLPALEELVLPGDAEGELITIGEVSYQKYTWPLADAESYEGYTYESYYFFTTVTTISRRQKARAE